MVRLDTGTTKPLVSIVMPLFNKASTVLETIASVRAQTVVDWELVVVDDGSTDGGAALVGDLGEQRICIVRQANAGVSAARNRGLEAARSDLIAFLDADDLWHPCFLATILGLHADFPEARWYATAYEIHPPEGKPHVSRLRGTPGFTRGFLKDYFVVASRSDPPVWTSAVAVQSEAIRMIGGFPVGIGSGEDLLTWSRLAVRFLLAYDVTPQAVFLVSGIERTPDPLGRVGNALEVLAQEHPDTSGLREYLGLWYRMQAVMALRFGQSSLARRLAWGSFRNAPGQWRNSYTLLLSVLPAVASGKLDKWCRLIFRNGSGKPSDR
jgi:glycosyltransferase involved in cell wall biosynthesis